MKKKIKALVIATSVAAVAGIGAVSFAAWAGGTTTETTNGTTGQIEFLSFNTTAATATITGLLPYDQNGTTALQTTADKTLGSVAFAAITLPTGYESANYNITVKAIPNTDNGKDISWTGADSAYTKIYVSATAPTAAITAVTGWEEASDADGATLTIAKETLTPTIYVIMDSNDSAQMDKEFKLEFTLSAAA